MGSCSLTNSVVNFLLLLDDSGYHVETACLVLDYRVYHVFYPTFLDGGQEFTNPLDKLIGNLFIVTVQVVTSTTQ